MNIPVVAIIGRPNVGKSTLFNRIIRKPIAITDDQPGVTRDRNTTEFEWNGRRFMLVDTGGFVITSQDRMERAVSEQSQIAIDEADVIIFLVDVKTGITDVDVAIRDEVLKSGKPYILAVNKVDRNNDEVDMYEFYNLGIGDPVPISGRTGRNSGDMLDEIVGKFPPEETYMEEGDASLRIALIGRPNVGKSSIVNSLVGSERVLVTDIPGTTRDSTDTPLEHNGRKITLVDTAGLKKLGRLKESVDYYSYLRTQTSLARCDVAVVVIDIDQGLTSYEKNVVADVENAGKGLIIAANKWDLIEKETMTMKHTTQEILDELPDKKQYPIVFTSALTGKRVDKLLDTAVRVEAARNFRIQTSAFNDFLEHLQIPSAVGDFTIQYGVQHGIAPPSFVLFVNDKRGVRRNFYPFFEHSLRDAFDFEGTPIVVTVKGKERKKGRK